MRRRRTATAIITAPASRRRAPRPTGPFDSAATGRPPAGAALAGRPELAEGDGTAPAGASADGVGVGAGGSATVTTVGVRPCVGSGLTETQPVAGVYVG